MIISLEDAQAINPEITQDELNGFETAVRQLTNNKFQNRNVMFRGMSVTNGNEITVIEDVIGLRVNDTIEIVDSKYNDGLYVVTALSDHTITVDGDLFDGQLTNALLFKIEYPADIKMGIKKLIKYDAAMAGKIGVKSETISRMSTTYYDATAAENIDGYPAAYLSFLKKYEKLRWG